MRKSQTLVEEKKRLYAAAVSWNYIDIMESETWSRYIVLGNVVVDYNIQIIRPSIHLPSPLMRLPFPFAPFKWTHREYSNSKLCFFVEHHLFLRQPSALNCFWWDYDGFCLLNVRTLCDVSTLLLRMLLRLSCRNEMERYEYIVFKRKMKKKWTKWKKKTNEMYMKTILFGRAWDYASQISCEPDMRATIYT